MADEDEDVIVSLPATEGEVKVTKADKVIENASFNDDPVADLKNQFATMQSTLASTQQTAQTTARELADTQQRLHVAETEVVSSQLDTVLSGIAAAEAEAKTAEGEFIAAAEAGDFVAQARAQRKMSGADSRIQRLVEAKEDLEDAAKRRPDPAAKPRQQPSQARQPADPVEALVQGLSAKSAAWVRAHPEVATNHKMNARMMAAHNLCDADGIERDSEEYFRRIEEGIKPVVTKKVEPNTGGGDGRRPSSAAAGGGNGGGGLNGGGTEVRLTKGEAASATDGTLVWNYDDPSGKSAFKKGDPIGLAEMARRKHEGMKAGLYDRSQA